MSKTISLAHVLAQLPQNQRVVFYTSRPEPGHHILGCRVEEVGNPKHLGQAATFTGCSIEGTSEKFNESYVIDLIDAAQNGGIWKGERKALRERENRQKNKRKHKRIDKAERLAEKERVTKLHEERLSAMTSPEQDHGT